MRGIGLRVDITRVMTECCRGRLVEASERKRDMIRKKKKKKRERERETERERER